MLLSGSRGAPYTCLRCQLRQAIFHSRRRCIDRLAIETARSFSATAPRRDQEDDGTIRIPHRRDDREVIYHRPLGRIVGEPGRRQRQGTQKLQIDAMKKPFEVIVMRDVREPEEQRPVARNLQSGAVLSAAQIEREMAREGVDPTQDEVNETINALRPETTLLDEGQYKELEKSLTDGFSTGQLHAFFTQSLNLSAVESDTVHLLRQQPSELQRRYRRTQWRAGRTRIETRLPLGTVVKKSEKTNKPKLVKQILRLTWNLSIHTEEQNIGELEMKLESWEMKYLFDLRKLDSQRSEQLMYQDIVDSPFLLRACDIRPYRPGGYLRISGRRQDAEEVARKIEGKLPWIERLTVELGIFAPLLGISGWPNTFDQLFRKEDIEYVQQRTFTIIEQPQAQTLHIHSNSRVSRWEARRLLLSLLELPTAASSTLVRHGVGKRDKAVLLPEAAGTAIHLRHRKLDLTRLTLPTIRRENTENASSPRKSRKESMHGDLSAICTKVLKDLAKTTSMSIPNLSNNASSRWDLDDTRTTYWRTQFCRVLHTSDEDVNATPTRGKTKKREGAIHDNMTIINAQTRNLETLLSFFTPRGYYIENTELAKSRPLLIARLVPSPFKKLGVEAMKRLPTVELEYYHFTNADGKPDIRFVGARAILERQDVRVPLPSETTDLCFFRRTTLHGRGSRLHHDSEINAFTQTLRDSLQSSKNGNLVGKPYLNIRLPRAIIPPGAANEDDSPDAAAEGKQPDVSYIFMGFEQVAKTEYAPLPIEKLPKSIDSEMRDVLKGFGETLFLQVKEIAAGTVGGRRMEVGLHYKPTTAKARGGEVAGEAERIGRSAGEEDGTMSEAAEDAPEIGSTSANGSVDANAAEMTDPDQAAILSQVVKTALGVARLLTKIGQDEIQLMLHHRAERGEAFAVAQNARQGKEVDDAFAQARRSPETAMESGGDGRRPADTA